MNQQIIKRILRTAILSLIALLVGGGVAYYQISQERPAVVAVNKSVPQSAGIPVGGMSIGGPFALVNHKGESVTNATYQDSYKFIYFGFTYCPAICPTELQKMVRVVNMLQPEQAQQIQPLFITVDPERDTAEVMREYVGLFDDRLEGLTGSVSQIEDVLKKFKVFARKVQDPQHNDYTMDHSSYLYFFSPEDELLGLYRIQDTAPFIAEDIRAKLL